jgi:hypothetical protein
MITGRILVFAGPSCPSRDRPPSPRLVWLPPAKAGDMIALDLSPGDCVVLIDGVFDTWPAVRHKELLMLLSRGVVVIGAASMGALRAAELAPYGMIGVGDVYRAFADGRLIGDDEVALLHGPAQVGWEPLTEPLVNVRATLQRAVRTRRLEIATARRLRQLAAAMFYKARTWPALLNLAAADGLDAADLAAFEGWLVSGRVDLKAIDARCALHMALTADLPAPLCEPPPATSFMAELARGLAHRPALE